MSETNEIIVVDKDTVDVFDPHGYICFFRRPVLNFKSPTKRSFLNECVRQLYLLNGDDMPAIANTAVYSRYHMWNTLNKLMEPKKMSHYHVVVERAKRRLFWDPKPRPRKSANVRRNIISKTECSYFKRQRSKLGVRKIPRNYLDQVRPQVYNEMRQTLKRKRMDDEHSVVNRATQPQSVFQVSSHHLQQQQVMSSKVYRFNDNTSSRSHSQRSQLCVEDQIQRQRIAEAYFQRHRARKLEDILLEQQYLERLLANENTLEASIRSILYIKSLMDIMESSSH